VSCNATCKNVPALDGIRGLAMLLVLMCHASQERVRPASFIDFDGCGYRGVFLFFVLSAFLLTKCVLDTDEKWLTRPIFWQNYFVRRCLRIYPLYTATLLVCLALDRRHTDDPRHFITSVRSVVEHLFLVRGVGVFWSVPVEFKYYFLLPPIAFTFAFFKRAPRTTVAVSLACVIWLHIVLASPPGLSLAPYLCFFLLGSLAAFVQWQLDHLDSRASRLWLTSGAALCALLAAVDLAMPDGASHAFGWPNPSSTLQMHFLATAVGWTAFILGTLNGPSAVRTFFGSRVMVWLGKISFSAYLGHMLVLRVAVHYLNSGALAWILFMVATLTLASCSYTLIERPFSRVSLLRGLRATPVDQT
jgi:peptidoglycan/LPS O-acetylase OafA/YrhL